MEESSDCKYFESTKSDYDVRMGKYDCLATASFLIKEEQMMQTIRNSLKRDCQSMCEEDGNGTDLARSECKKRKTMMKKKNVKKVMGGSSKIAKKKSSEHWLCNSCTYDYRG
ncbi:hypothetical protein ACFX1W_039633 [Malus domestica]